MRGGGVRAVLVVALLGFALLVSGCRQGVPTSGGTAEEKSSTAVGNDLDHDDLWRRWAWSIGGTQHQGKTLYFIVGAKEKTESSASARLVAAQPLFGDMQSYFIVQHSDNLSGMEPGWWVIVEAYRGKPTSENLDLAKRAFGGAYVQKASVLTTDPIPVYEELVGQ